MNIFKNTVDMTASIMKLLVAFVNLVKPIINTFLR